MRSSLVLALALTAACSKASTSEQPADQPAAQPAPSGAQPAPAAAPASPDTAARAKEIYSQRCVPCHGPSGGGDGAASAGLNPKPRNFGDAAWQKSVEDAYLMKVIQYGGAAVGKSAAMPGNPDLTDPAMLSALKDVVRGFSK